MPEAAALAVVILAAGRGTRMKSARPKVLHPVAGRALIRYPLALAEALAPARVLLVTSADAELQNELQKSAASAASDATTEFVAQPAPRGTGDAVRCALDALGGEFAGEVLVLCGDAPLLRLESVQRLRATFAQARAQLALLTSPAPLPGIVLRADDGAVTRIVERSDASAQEKTQREGFSGVLLADAAFLRAALAELDAHNAQRELYLTGVVAVARARGAGVCALQLDDPEEALGVNDRAELARANAVQFRRNAQAHMANGVSFLDPSASYVDTGVEIGADTRVDPGVVITAPARIGRGAHIKAHSVIEGATLGDGVVVGPSAHLRPGTVLGDGARVGNFVEVKNSRLGAGVKADHLAYIGDADVGAGASFGCGAITVNYDWDEKHRTTVGARARIGCNANLIAPVTVAADAFVAAGATVTEDVPSHALALAGTRQLLRKNWGRERAKKLGARKRED